MSFFFGSCTRQRHRWRVRRAGCSVARHIGRRGARCAGCSVARYADRRGARRASCSVARHVGGWFTGHVGRWGGSRSHLLVSRAATLTSEREARQRLGHEPYHPTLALPRGSTPLTLIEKHHAPSSWASTPTKERHAIDGRAPALIAAPTLECRAAKPLRPPTPGKPPPFAKAEEESRAREEDVGQSCFFVLGRCVEPTSA